MPRLKDWIAQADKVQQPVAAQPSQAEARYLVAWQQSDPELQQHITQLQKAFTDRVAAHGQRLFRHPDGSLQESRPNANPYAAATRRKWKEVVRHCQVTGGDPEFTRTGKSWRYNNGTSKEDHNLLLSCIGLHPEPPVDKLQQENPLANPEHCFNTFLAEHPAKVDL